MKRICKQCGKEFVLTQEEIAFYQSKNLQIPKRCEKCRRENKAGGRTGKRMQPAARGKYQTGKEPAQDTRTGGELSGNDFESVTRPGQVVRAYQGKEKNLKKSWAVIAAVLILFAVVTFGLRMGFMAGQDDGTAQDQTVQTLTEEIPETEDSKIVSDIPEAEDSKAASDIPEAENPKKLLDIADVEKSADDVIEGTEAEAVRGSKTESGSDSSQNAAAEEMSAAELSAGESVEVEAPAVTYTYNFRRAEYLQEHFAKHGAEFGYTSAEEYLAGANRVIASADALHKLEAEDGDDVYYLEAANEFVIVSTDGFLRTYFKPEDGKAYFDRQ